MNSFHFRQLFFVCLSFFLLLNSSACTSTTNTKFSDDTPGTYVVHTLFREYYQDLGGKERFGPAISQIFDRDKYECQYTVNALLCHNPLATGSARFFMAPLGTNLILSSDSTADTSAIYPDFLPLYKELTKYNAVGQTLTGVHYNYEQQRVEQYFENIGLYHRFDDAHGNVKLLPYGEYFCGNDCTYAGVAAQDQITPQYPEISSPFGTSLERIGGMQTFGRPLTHPYDTSEGYLEQVYENVVVYAPQNNLSDIHLRPLPELLDLKSNPPGTKVYGVEQNMVFYTTSGELGYHVPVIFDNFITLHGGLEISGDPINDPFSDPLTGIPRQCFTNYCLDYHSEAEKEYQTRMAPLGTQYLQETQGTNDLISRYVYANENVHMQLSEQKPQITSSEELIVDLLLVQSEDQSPISNVESKVTLTFPDGEQESFVSSSTNPQGHATITIPAQTQLKTGDLVSYKVCLNVPSETPICIYDSYLIWNLQE